MKTILSYLLSPIFWLFFGLMLAIFHPIQVFCRLVLGQSVRKKSVDVLNFILVYSLWILGARIRFKGFDQLPKYRPLIIVSNHQSFFDIPPIVIGFRRHFPKFVSKKELAKSIPSVSYNLRYGGSALIDRKNKRQALVEIAKLGKKIENDKTSVCIYPEGTRSKTGKINRYKHAGIAALLKKAPSALIVPFVIDGNSKLISKGYFPLQFGTKLTYTVLKPIDPTGKDPEELTKGIEMLTKKELGQVGK